MFFSELGCLSEIRKVLKNYSCQKVMLVTGRNSFVLSGAKEIIEKSLYNIDFIVFNEFDINPKFSDALKGALIAEQNSIDMIICIGGGSVIDMGKLIKVFYNRREEAKDIVEGLKKISDNNIPIIAIPTTAGSGSEATHFAVVYMDSLKFSVAHLSLTPSSVLLDGRLSVSASKYQKACNVLDSVSQSIESAWAINSSKKSKQFAYESLEISLKVAEKFINSENNFAYAQKMLEAANLAGKAINISKTTSAHAWSYGFSMKYDIPHGHSVWLTLPKIFKIHAFNLKKKKSKNKTYEDLYDVMENLKDIFSINANDEIETYFDSFLEKMGIEKRCLSDFNFSRPQRYELSRLVNKERMNNNPVTFDISDVNEIFNL